MFPGEVRMYLTKATAEPRRMRALAVLGGRGVDLHHRLAWTLFPHLGDDGVRRLDATVGGQRMVGDSEYVFRVAGSRPLTMFLRSRSKPADTLGCFDLKTVEEPTAWSVGTRLRFRVSAVATRCKATSRGKRGKRFDVSFLEWLALPERRRAQISVEDVMHVAVPEWLAGHGLTRGFSVSPDEVIVQERRRHSLKGRCKDADFSSYELSGYLTVTDSTAFEAVLRQGIGRERGYGFGMLMVAPEDSGDSFRMKWFNETGFNETDDCDVDDAA
jgi:CRISPR-associated protein Cas6/Cse3/CasE subtype I-E